MAQKFIKSQNKNSQSTAFGKYFATAVYDEKFITTEQIADFIQQQCSIKKSDIKAALDELGGAMKHFFELGQKIRLDGIGIFKVGFSSIGVTKLEDCSAATITERYVVAKSLIKDVLFEETHENAMKNPSAGSGTVDDPSAGSETGGGNNSGGSGIIPTPTDPEDDQPGD